MANLLETIRSSVLDSIKGRKIGLNPTGYLVGIPDMIRPMEDLTTAASTLTPYGISRITATGSTQGPVQYTLPVPVPGTVKIITCQTTSTGSYQFLSTSNGAAIYAASDGTTKSQINFVGPGGTVTLLAVTSTIWAVQSIAGSTVVGNFTYTTST